MGTLDRATAVHLADARLTDARLADARLADARLTDARLTDDRLADPRLADVRLDGDVERATVLTVPELRALPQRTIEAAFGCRRVGAQRHLFEAVPLLEVAMAARPRFDPDLAKDRLRFLLAVTGRDGHCAVFSWGEIDPRYGAGEALLATSMDGAPLDEAGPHLVVPHDVAGGRYVSRVASIWVGPAARMIESR